MLCSCQQGALSSVFGMQGWSGGPKWMQLSSRKTPKYTKPRYSHIFSTSKMRLIWCHGMASILKLHVETDPSQNFAAGLVS